MSFAQYTDNVFDQNKAPTGESAGLDRSTQAEENSGVFAPTEEDQSSSLGVPGPGEHEEAPGNPGEPVPINDYIPYLVVVGLFLIVYYQRKNKKINI